MHVLAKNKKAKFDYEFKDKFIAGISLTGTEVKSIKSGGCDLTGSYVIIDSNNNAQWLNGHITKYKFQTQGSHEERRTRQLLLNKKEIRKLKELVNEQRVTIIPYVIGADRRGRLKLELYSSKSKNKQDKRETIKKRDAQRESKRHYE